jgi:hypothetical protein
MSASKTASQAYPLLIDALRLLPVHPLRERENLGVARHRALQDGTGELHGVPVPAADLEQLFMGEDAGAPRISPAGASFLLRLYKDGVLEVSPRRRDADGLELLEAFAQGRASILGRAFWLRPRTGKTRRVTPREIEVPASTPVVRPNDRVYRITTHRLT